jgi:hypothetical protein
MNVANRNVRVSNVSFWTRISESGRMSAAPAEWNRRLADSMSRSSLPSDVAMPLPRVDILGFPYLDAIADRDSNESQFLERKTPGTLDRWQKTPEQAAE